MPRFNDTPLCGMGSAACFYQAKEYIKYEIATRNKDIKDIYKNVCHCLPSCVSLSYKAEISQSSFIADQKINNNKLSLS